MDGLTFAVIVKLGQNRKKKSHSKVKLYFNLMFLDFERRYCISIN